MDEWERMRRMYADRLAKTGYSPETLGWTKPKHLLRYHVLLSYWMQGPEPLAQQAKVLDFGCGFGDLAPYARQLGIDVDYHGIDISPDLIAAGRKAHPDLRLDVGSPIEEGLSENYDIILSSGAHNFAMADNWDYICRTFDLFDRHSRVGFAINFLSTRVNFRNSKNYYADPPRMLGLALEYSRRVELRHDYMPFEFTLFVDKRESFGDLTVFTPFEQFCS